MKSKTSSSGGANGAEKSNLPVSVPFIDSSPLLVKQESINLDSFEEEPIKKGLESPVKKEPDLAS